MTVTKKILVTLETEIELTLPEEIFTDAYFKDWNKRFFEVESVEDIIVFIAEQAVFEGSGHCDGIGLLVEKYSKDEEKADVIFELVGQSTSIELITDIEDG